MRGLVILLITFTLIKNLIAKDLSEGISGSDIPQMRTGFSLQTSNTENFNAACRRLVIARFSENIRNVNPDDAEKILNTIQTIIPASDFAAISGESAGSLLTQIATFKFEVQRVLNFYKKLLEVSSSQEIFWGSYYNLKYSHQNLPL